jgi:hypothetical protein
MLSSLVRTSQSGWWAKEKRKIALSPVSVEKLRFAARISLTAC